MEKEKKAIEILRRLKTEGHQALFAGGCVRDRLRNESPKDFDIATSATPDQVMSLFPKTLPVGVQFGVVLVIEPEGTFEVATFRTEGDYLDGRRPSVVSFVGPEEDAKRRDFTVNGLFFDPTTSEYFDWVDGQKDLAARVIRTIGDPDKRFQEDHLRLMRAVRFSVQLGFEIAPETRRSIQKHAPLLAKVSSERIRDEFTKILTSPNPHRGVLELDAMGLLKIVLPEMETMKGVEQPMQYHPEGDVFVHTMILLENMHPNPPVELALGALLHDVAKPCTFVRAPDRIRFHGHDRIGAEMSRAILKRLCYSNQTTEIVESLVAEHLRFKDVKHMREATLRRFLSLPHFDLHLELHRLDCLASHGDLTAYQFCQEKVAFYSKQPPPPKKLIGGADLIALGYSPGPEFSEILRAVEDAILEGTIRTREEALAWVKDRG